ncbi:hypothetical protein LSCM1_04493 [Leishmania martiniquensis]|uniref:Uncharacterized protein n=1 Tax=Leishmania martiniquensis TaxID=1580590 RepID=A0A836GK96_9TRYP|nr:hypothetical protein LSCM1_04493 [Leishmania martiniquensis]
MSTHKAVTSHPDATASASLRTTSLLPSAASLATVLLDAPTSGTNRFAPQSNSGSSHGKTPGNHHAQAAAEATLASSRTGAKAAARIISSALLDVSFDSRVFAANDAATSTEIQRLGIRLQELHHEHNTSGVARQASALLSSATSDPMSTSKGPSEVLPGVPVKLLEPPPLPESVEALYSKPGIERRHVYDETMKFVHLIREMNEERAVEHAGHRWFRWKELPPNKEDSGGCGALGAAAVTVNHTMPPTVAERALSGASEHEGVPVGGLVDNLHRRPLLRLRDRISTHVRWMPYEMRNTDLRPGCFAMSACFCGFQAAETLAGGAEAVHLREHLSDADIDLATSHSQHLLKRGVSSSTTPTVADTPPLPSVAPLTGRPSHHGTDADKESTNCFEDSNGPLSSSAGTITSTNAPSISSDSLSFCPGHVAHRPVSILMPGKGKQSVSTTCSSSGRRNLLEPLQVEVPVTVATRPAAAKPVAACLPPSGTQCPTDDGCADESGRRRIIDADVPHRKQLAKRALEDNKLFFELSLRKKSVS